MQPAFRFSLHPFFFSFSLVSLHLLIQHDQAYKLFAMAPAPFSQTLTKPVLFFSPAPQHEAQARLAALRRQQTHHGGGQGTTRGDELRRYTFQDGKVVDLGPNKWGAQGQKPGRKNHG